MSEARDARDDACDEHTAGAMALIPEGVGVKFVIYWGGGGVGHRRAVGVHEVSRFGARKVLLHTIRLQPPHANGRGPPRDGCPPVEIKIKMGIQIRIRIGIK